MKNLNRTDRELLNHLAFREAGSTGRPCWMYWMPGDRWQLVVWTMMHTWAQAPFVKRGRTLSRLIDAGLIVNEGNGHLPYPHEDKLGSIIRITDAGRDALGVNRGSN